MPGNIPAFQLTATKISTTDTPKNVLLQFIRNGNVVFAACIPGADFTSINTTVNGGAAGVSLTVPSNPPYAQDTSKGDYGVGYAPV